MAPATSPAEDRRLLNTVYIVSKHSPGEEYELAYESETGWNAFPSTAPMERCGRCFYLRARTVWRSTTSRDR